MKPFLPILSCLVLPDIFFAFLIATRPPFVLRLLGSMIIVYSAYYVAATYSTGDVGADLSLGSALGSQPLSVLLLLWSSNPMKDFRYISDSDSSALKERPLRSRMYNAWCILRNSRFVGLNVQLPHVPPPFRGTRYQFIRSRIMRVLLYLLLIDLAQSFTHTHPAHFLQGQGTPAFPRGLYGGALYFACQVSWASCVYATINLVYTITSLVCVIVGEPVLAGTPESWPDMFGPWAEAYTVRRTWGRVWHQTLRRNFAILGKHTNPPGTGTGGGKGTGGGGGAKSKSFLVSQIHIWAAFTLSGMMHCFGDLMVGREFVGRSLPFFLMNALAITFEDSVIAVTRGLLEMKMGLRGRQTRTMVLQGRHTRRRTSRFLGVAVGYVWVVMWFSWSLPCFYTWALKLGLGRKEVLPFSFVRFVLALSGVEPG